VTDLNLKHAKSDKVEEVTNFLNILLMPSDKPRVTLYLDTQEMEVLAKWASQEFLTVPQLTRVVVKRAIAEYLKQHPLEAVADAPRVETSAIRATAAKTKTKQIRGKTK
jgi:cobalamin-dependent methionine synthase I